MKINNFNSVLKKTLLMSMLFFSVTTLKAQLTGVKTIPTDYASIAAFVTDLNTQGVGAGGVMLDIPSGYTETAPAGGFLITATGTSGNNIIITSTGGAPLPIITASSSLTAGLLNDAIFKIVGGDYITISNLDLRENAANTVTTAGSNTMTEWGIALLYATTTNGCQNVSILNNTIALGATYQNAMGIYANSTHAAGTPTTSATGTTLTGGNHNLAIKGNTISNVNLGIVVVGPTAAADMNNTVSIGGTTPAEGNTITYGLTGTFSSYANVSGTVNGILVRNSINATVSNNSLTSNGSVTAGTLNGIQFPGFSNAPTGTFTQNINNNTLAIRSNAVGGNVVGITQPSGSATVTSICNINNNNFTNFGHSIAAASGSLTFISLASTHFTTNINSNTFTNISVNTTGSVTFVSHSYTMPANATKSVSNNAIVTGFTKTGAGGTVTFMTTNGSSPNNASGVYSNNTISNITLTGATTFTAINDTDGSSSGANKIFNGNTISNINGGTSTITGINCTYWGGTSSSISNNTLSNINGQGTITGINLGSTFNGATNSVLNANSITGLTSSGAGGAVTGISCSNTSTGILITNSTINGLSSTGASAVTGISISGSTSTAVVANKIHSLSSSNAGGSVNGILVSAGTLSILTNNVIGNLTASVANAANPINGINITGGTAVNAFYNSVFLNATSSGALFGSSAISVSTTPTVTLRNNIFINESSFTGAGFSVAVRRSSTTLTSYSAASNNNLLYSGTPSANNLVMYDGTNSYSTLLAYQTAVLPRDANSITGEAVFTASGYGTAGNFFISLTPSSADYLKPVAGITTQTESGAQNISGITTDYSAVTRAGNAGYSGTGSNPDMGAYEFEGVSPAPVIVFNSITPSTSNQCVATPRVISVNATTISGTITGANIGYSVNGVPQTNIVMTNTSGSTWEGTISVPTPSNATIAWGVSATNSLGLNSSYTGTTYSDEPLTGVTASASASSSTICANNPTQLSTSLSKVGTVTVGTGSLLTGATSQPTAFCNRWSSYRMQTVYTAAELNAAGLSAGPITSIAYSITTLGDAATNANYTVKIGTTGATSFTDFISSTGFTTVFPAATYTHAIGLNTVTFVTPYNWDGVSNLVVEVSHDGANLTNNSQTYYTTTALNTVAYSTNGSAIGTPSNQRLNVVIGGNTAPAITSVTWSDGATTVGTGNPLTVNPTTTTTYTATITSAGCTVSPAPTVTVTVNPLPTAPTASNSSQCGTQIPTASVASTSGLPSPTFKWYDAAIGGTVLQNSSSTTYTSNVAATTTFYVAEVNASTGCESPRTAVTVTVVTADGILAAINNATICIGSSVTLTATNTNATPNQSYTYTWTGIAGSGVASLNGSSATVTPTLPGTYTYNLAGIDGGCNAVSSVNVTVNPFVAAITPVNATCNAGNDGSFTLGTTTCGTAPYTYSVNGGAYGSIPTNLIAGTYSVLVKDANGYISAALPLTITQPATTITNPTVTNASVCQNSTSATVTASATTSVPTAASTVVNFNVATQPAESFAAPGNIVASATVPSLPAGSTITSLVINYNGITPNATGEYQSDVRLGLSGAYTNANAAGTGTTGFGTVIGVPFNYTRTINSPVGFPLTGGTINLTYHNDFNDATTTIDALFALGNVASLVINYTSPTPATITWWDAPVGGTQIGAGSPFESVGTSVLPTTATTGVYTLYAQGQNGACPSPGRTAATVTINAPSTSTTTITACGSYTWTNGTNYTTTGTYTQTLTNAVGCDSIATLALTIKQPSASSTPVTACSSYTWTNGTTYNTSGTYTQTLTNAVGCDSIATLVLTINQPTSSSTPVTACSSYTWTNGTTYVVSGTYTQTLTNAVGCDSIATLVLTINQPTSSSTPVTACDSYTWTNGTTYVTSGTYTQTLVNSVGCDSIATLVLTINNSTTGTDVITACDSYTWIDGVNYTTSNSTATFTLTNAAGCDSIVTLNLTINNSNTGTDVITACDSYTWIDGVNYTTSNSTATFTLTNAAGCDSIVTLNLTINTSTTGTDVIAACDSYTWIDGVTYTTNNSTATFTLTNAAGCDSIVTLNLTITATPVAVATDNGNATISSATAASYQWIDCATGNPIAGATSQVYTVTANGTYAVIASNGSCSDTSACVTIDYISVKEISFDMISIYPNPTRDNVTVTMSSASASIEIIDAQGKLLNATQVVNGDKIDLSTYETGMYIFRVKTENGTSIFRVSKN
jgi:hypothetical protein